MTVVRVKVPQPWPALVLLLLDLISSLLPHQTQTVIFSKRWHLGNCQDFKREKNQLSKASTRNRELKRQREREREREDERVRERERERQVNSDH